MDLMGKPPLSLQRLAFLALIAACSVAVIAGTAYGYIAYRTTAYEKQVFEERTAALEQTVDAMTGSLGNEKALNKNLTDDNTSLNEALIAEQGRNLALSSQIQELTGTVGKLKKLSETPPELLKKYSKVYFLNENYVPSPLANIDGGYLLKQGENEQILAAVWPFITRMLVSADREGKKLQVVSAYRSFEKQAAVKSGYRMLYGYGANQFSAEQGYSEHQLGTTVDLTTPAIVGLTTKLDATPEYDWLMQNAYRYGFVLSYPKGNTYYQYEPWHWRFVGVALATFLHDQNKHFYDLSQAEIDPYLISIFD
ncbi:MAG: hypothetical protein RL681_248 [Candidatus Parcubacteria bacterium]|jgi:D-alanyl-D-alanine carboxypeptidase